MAVDRSAYFPVHARSRVKCPPTRRPFVALPKLSCCVSCRRPVGRTRYSPGNFDRSESVRSRILSQLRQNETVASTVIRTAYATPHSVRNSQQLSSSTGGADKSLARPTSRCILFDGENISFDVSLVIYINSTNIPPIMIINRIYEHQNLLSL